jgi:hypothetical protein
MARWPHTLSRAGLAILPTPHRLVRKPGKACSKAQLLRGLRNLCSDDMKHNLIRLYEPRGAFGFRVNTKSRGGRLGQTVHNMGPIFELRFERGQGCTRLYPKSRLFEVPGCLPDKTGTKSGDWPLILDGGPGSAAVAELAARGCAPRRRRHDLCACNDASRCHMYR